MALKNGFRFDEPLSSYSKTGLSGAYDTQQIGIEKISGVSQYSLNAKADLAAAPEEQHLA